MKPTVCTRDLIHRLPGHLINLIAAGEVVERPASVVKELVENSLDAGASRVEIRLAQGGTQSIEIIDDGCGMSLNDLKLCVERHATSKLVDESSLGAIETFGFRGEALSSIAAVAQVTIKTRPKDESRGYLLSMQFGEAEKTPTIVGAPSGTTVVVTGLFERVPARAKFLRSPSTELAYCHKIVKELALGNPGVSFFVGQPGGSTKTYHAVKRADRVREALKVSWEFVCVAEENEMVKLDAYLSPAHVTCDRGELYIIVNGRSVRNRNLLSAVRSAYLDALGPHHEPTGVVYLDILSDHVDVNVHPQKTQVRILKGESLYSWIVASIRKQLAREPVSVREFVFPTTTELPLTRPAPAFAHGTPAASGAVLMAESVLPVQPPVYGDSITVRDREARYQPEPLTPEGRLRYLGQIRASFLVCEDGEGLLLVDQHALHEKFRFEELLSQVQEQGIGGQRLLFPKIVELSADKMALATQIAPDLSRLGMGIDLLGEDTIAISSIPAILDEAQAEAVLLKLLKTLLADGRCSVEGFVRPYLATVACHSVVRANQKLTDPEALNLLSYLKEIEMGWTCPHGRPVLFRLGFAEMERYFERT